MQELLDLRRLCALASKASSQSVSVLAATLLRLDGGGGFASCNVRAVVHKRVRRRALHPLQMPWVQVLWPKHPTEAVAAATAALATAAAAPTPTAKAAATLARICCLPNPTR